VTEEATATPEDPNQVNPHYLDHMVATTAQHAVEVTEDIVTGNGIKLLAKGARIDPAVRERLLQHKLQKPLEECVQVVGGVSPERFGPIADELLAEYPLLASLCQTVGAALPIPASLMRLKLSGPVQSLLTVYAQYQPDRLRHGVGVAMLAMGLGRTLVPGDIDRHRLLALAGLLHDVGELYIDPGHLKRGAQLAPEAWRHIVSHPVIAHRVLKDMDGAGPALAQAVLLHHERLDGFGYPRGVAGSSLSLDGQILGAAEWLMALQESGLMPLARLIVATRIIPGEFSQELVQTISDAAAGIAAPQAAPTPLEEAVPRVARIAATMRRFAQHRAWIDERIAEARGELKRALASGLVRMQRLQTAFSSTGLDAADSEALLRQLAALHDPQVHLEVITIVREIEWRLRSLERESLLRSGLLKAEEDAVMRELIARLTGAWAGEATADVIAALP
jgi:HD-GYP domain-containing protein (c-di-GMP phosphodiesterase class II)